MSSREQAPDTPVFVEPWQAEAFALTVALHDRGVFTWSEWADAFSSEVRAADAAMDGSDYYDRWLRALETLLAAKGITNLTEIDGMAHAWEQAAHATPHGQPIRLENARRDQAD